jgi:uncharacterized protein (TIGR00369 family)
MRALPPYADLLGIRAERTTGGRLLLVMPFGDHLIGRPDFLHGGTIAGLLEMAAFAQLHEELGVDRPRIKPINVTVDFMRGGRDKPTRSRGTVTRLGTRVANVETTAWQDDPAKPIAAARMNYLILRP